MEDGSIMGAFQRIKCKSFSFCAYQITSSLLRMMDICIVCELLVIDYFLDMLNLISVTFFAESKLNKCLQQYWMY